MRRKRPPRPHNPDPERYEIVRGKYKDYLRLKRGSRKKAVVNETLKNNNIALTALSPLTSQIKYALEQFTYDLDTDWVHSRMNGLFLKGKVARNKYDLSWMQGLDFQHGYPLMSLLKFRPKVIKDIEAGELKVQIDVGTMGAIGKPLKHVDAYAVLAILVQGRLDGKSPLRHICESSPVYDFGIKEDREQFCEIVLPYPEEKGSWLLCVRVECYEKGVVYGHFKTKGMMVVDGGMVI